MKNHVACYAGSTYPEKPRAVVWEEQEYEVNEIRQRWKTPEGVGFLVQCSPGQTIFNLFYFTTENRWRIQRQ